jgi:hypothetical protein
MLETGRFYHSKLGGGRMVELDNRSKRRPGEKEPDLVEGNATQQVEVGQHLAGTEDDR